MQPPCPLHARALRAFFRQLIVVDRISTRINHSRIFHFTATIVDCLTPPRWRIMIHAHTIQALQECPFICTSSVPHLISFHPQPFTLSTSSLQHSSVDPAWLKGRGRTLALQVPQPAASSLFLSNTSRNEHLTLYTMSSIPTSLYDILQNDYVHETYMAPIDGRFDTGTGESFYPLSLNEVLAPTFPKPNNVFFNQCPDGGLSPAFPTYNAVPHFQTPHSFTRTPSSSSGSSTSLEPSPNLSLGDSPQLYPEQEDNLSQPIATPPAKSEVATSGRRSRGPNKRPPGTGYADLVVRSFHLVLNNNKRRLP